MIEGLNVRIGSDIMPWSNQGGGGPWGGSPGGGGSNGGGGGGPWNGGGGNHGGGNNPWGGSGGGGNRKGPFGGGGGGGGQQPPDLEDLIRQGQERLKGWIPGGGSGGWLIGILAALVVGGWLATGFYRVETGSQGVELVFGAYVETTAPGLRYNWPSPIGQTFTPQVDRVNRIDIGFSDVGARGANTDVPDESLMLTGDENIIDLDFSVFWRIQDARNFLFRIRDPEATVKRVAESAMREVIGQTPIQPALNEGRAQIQVTTTEVIQQILDDYQSGILITDLQMQQVRPPPAVVDAFDDVQRAAADRVRIRNQAEAFRNDIIPRARGEAQQMLQQASAYREQVVNRARGDADRFNSVYESWVLSRDVTTRRLYLETLETVLSQANKIVIDTNSVGGSGVVPYLPLDQLNRRAVGGN